MNSHDNDVIRGNSVFLWIGLATVAILSIPFVSMQFASSVDWSLGDFIVFAILLFGAGSLFVLLARMTGRRYRLLIGLVILGAALWLWAELAVGVFTNWGS